MEIVIEVAEAAGSGLDRLNLGMMPSVAALAIG